MHTSTKIAIKFLHNKMTAFVLPFYSFQTSIYIKALTSTHTPVAAIHTHTHTVIKSDREQTSEQPSEKNLKLLVFGMCVMLNCRSHFFQKAPTF